MVKEIFLIGSSGAIGSHVKTFLQNDFKIVEFRFHNWLNLQLFQDEINKYIKNLFGKSLIIIWTAGSIHPRSTSGELIESSKVFESFLDIINNSKLNFRDLKIIYLSSTGSIYPYHLLRVNYEDSPTEPTSAYGVMKLQHEKLIHESSNYKTLKSIILRSPSVFGSVKFKNTGIINQILYNEDFELKANLETVRQYLHIQDLCSLIKKTIIFDEFESCLVKNIAPSQSYSVRDLILKHGSENLIAKIQSNTRLNSKLDNQTILVGSKTTKELDLSEYLMPDNLNISDRNKDLL